MQEKNRKNEKQQRASIEEKTARKDREKTDTGINTDSLSRRQAARLMMKKQKRRFRVLKISILVIILILAAFYIAGVVFFNSHFYARGSVFGIKMKYKTVESLKSEVDAKVKQYQITVKSIDGEDVITAADMDLGYSDDGNLDKMMEEQNPYLWFLMSATPENDQTIEVEMNEDMLSEKLSSLECMQDENMRAPTDAHLEYSDGAFQVIPEDYGTQLNKEKTVYEVTEAVYNGQEEISLVDAGCYVTPTILEDDENLREECENANKVLNVEITYDFGDRTEVVNADLISQWIIFNADFTYTLDEDKVADYVHELGLKYDTFGLSHTFTTHSGNTITLTGGDYGWCINKKKTTQQLIDLINAGESVTTEPEYLYSGLCRDTDDIGDYYIEVCISEQMMYMYKDGQCIVSTPVVTGNVANGTETPSGSVWAIDARIRDYTLTGQDYNSDVSYWMPFTGDVGIHDATWRSEFGGEIYKTNGSHGCVNTPLDAMKTIYENAKIGMPVIVY